MIEVQGLTKRYGDVEAVRGIDLEVQPGEIVAFLGPNGAGKTTTIEILEGFHNATSGTARVMGQDPATADLSWRERLGIVLQESEPIPSLTVLETLKMQANYYSSSGSSSLFSSPDDLLQLVGLSDAVNQRTSKLSGGQKRRLDLASALVGDPDLIFLDEPTTGFDPSARRESWKMIEALRDLKKTVLLTTHYMDEAQHLADRIVIINRGVIVARGTAAELATSLGVKTTISWSCRDSQIFDALSRDLEMVAAGSLTKLAAGHPDKGNTDGHTHYKLSTDRVTQTLRVLLSVTKNDSEILNLEVINPTLEDIYLELVASDDEEDHDSTEPSHG